MARPLSSSSLSIGDGETIGGAAGIAEQARGADGERAGAIEAGAGQMHIAQADEIAGHGLAIGGGGQPPMHGHGLGGNFNAAGGAERAVGAAQRVIRRGETLRQAAHRGRVPVQHLVEQAHGAGMRNHRQNFAPAEAAHAGCSGQPLRAR